jgi:hypothetical protein
MFGIDPVSLSAAYILAGVTAAGCPPQQPVEVDVQFVRKDSPYITDQTSAQLTQKYGADPDATLATDGNWMVGGVTVVSGEGLSSQTQAQFSSMQNPRSGEVCFVVDKVNYTINYGPQIYIASDFKGLGCRYSVTLMHEKRHVETDVRTITDFIPQMRRDIEKYATGIGPQGPFPASEMQNQTQRVLRQISDGLRPQWDELLALRRKRQAEIDTEARYRRDTALCPGQFPKFDGSR